MVNVLGTRVSRKRAAKFLGESAVGAARSLSRLSGSLLLLFPFLLDPNEIKKVDVIPFELRHRREQRIGVGTMTGERPS